MVVGMVPILCIFISYLTEPAVKNAFQLAGLCWWDFGDLGGFGFYTLFWEICAYCAARLQSFIPNGGRQMDVPLARKGRGNTSWDVERSSACSTLTSSFLKLVRGVCDGKVWG